MILALPCLCLVALSPESATPEPLVIAELRDDGIVVPFARYNDTKWTPLPLDSLPKNAPSRNTWYIASQDAEPREIHGGLWVDLVEDPSGEAGPRFRGQLTDYCQQANPVERGSPRFVVSDPRGVSPCEDIPPDSETWRRVLACIRPEFERSESLAVETSGAPRPDTLHLQWGHPVSPKARRTYPLAASVTAVRVVGGSALFHITATRKYPGPSWDEVCDGLSVFDGWVRESGGRPAVLSPHFTIENCDAKGITFSTPMLSLTSGGCTFVLVDETGYEWGAYVILELGSDGPKRVLEYVYHCL